MTIVCFYGILLLLLLNLLGRAHLTRTDRENQSNKDSISNGEEDGYEKLMSFVDSIGEDVNSRIETLRSTSPEILNHLTSANVEKKNGDKNFFSPLKTLDGDGVLPTDDPKLQLVMQKQPKKPFKVSKQQDIITGKECRLLINKTNKRFKYDAWNVDWEKNGMTVEIYEGQLIIAQILLNFSKAVAWPKGMAKPKSFKKVLGEQYQDYRKAQDVVEVIAANAINSIKYTIRCLRAIDRIDSAREIFLSIEKNQEIYLRLEKFYEAACQKSQDEYKRLCRRLHKLFDRHKKFEDLGQALAIMEEAKAKLLKSVQKMIQEQNRSSELLKHDSKFIRDDQGEDKGLLETDETSYKSLLVSEFSSKPIEEKATKPKSPLKFYASKSQKHQNNPSGHRKDNDRPIGSFSLKTLEEDHNQPVDNPTSRELETQKQLDELLKTINQQGEMTEEQCRLLIDYTSKSFKHDSWNMDWEKNCIIVEIYKYQFTIAQTLYDFLESVGLPENVVKLTNSHKEELKNAPVYDLETTNLLKNQAKYKKIPGLYFGAYWDIRTRAEKYVAHAIWYNYNLINCLRAINSDDDAREIFLHLDSSQSIDFRLKEIYQKLCQENSDEDKALCAPLKRIPNQREKFFLEFNSSELYSDVEFIKKVKPSIIFTLGMKDLGSRDLIV